MMPIRRRTRAQNQAQQIAYERALNDADLQAIAAAQEAAREAGENDIPPPR